MEDENKEPDDIDYLKMALALSGVCINRFTSELIIETWEGIRKKHGQFNISDAVHIEWGLRKRYKEVTAIVEPTEI